MEISEIEDTTKLPNDGQWHYLAGPHPRTIVKVLDEGRYVGVMPLIFTHAVIVGHLSDPLGYDDRWCYHSGVEALAAASAWDGTGEPTGWHRHPGSGRRREGGDPDREVVIL